MDEPLRLRTCHLVDGNLGDGREWHKDGGSKNIEPHGSLVPFSRLLAHRNTSLGIGTRLSLLTLDIPEALCAALPHWTLMGATTRPGALLISVIASNTEAPDCSGASTSVPRSVG